MFAQRERENWGVLPFVLSCLSRLSIEREVGEVLVEGQRQA